MNPKLKALLYVTLTQDEVAEIRGAATQQGLTLTALGKKVGISELLIGQKMLKRPEAVAVKRELVEKVRVYLGISPSPEQQTANSKQEVSTLKDEKSVLILPEQFDNTLFERLAVIKKFGQSM
jgi:hypothetical protein